MKIVVTGANGFIGRHLLSSLAGLHEVFAIARGPRLPAPFSTVSVIEADLSRPLEAKRLPAQADVIIHLAQANVSFPEAANELFAVNTSSTQQLLDYGRLAGARQFILASTGDVYGKRFGPSKETDPARPASYYGVTKHAAELLVQSYSGYLLPCVLRLYQPYGPGQSARVIPKLASRICRQEPIKLHRGSRPQISPVYIADVVRAIERAVGCSYSGVVNIAGDKAVSMRELAEEIGRALATAPVFEETDEESADLAGDNSLMKETLATGDLVPLSVGLSRALKGKEAVEWQAHP